MRKISIILAALAALFTLAGCTIPAEKTSAPPAAGAEAQPSADTAEETDDPGVAKVGEWMKAEDGVMFRVSRLSRGRVGPYAAGGHPGDPAVIVTVQIKNGSDSRLDLTLLNVVARLGADGREAEQVYDGEQYGAPSGSLSKGRTSTSRYMFAAEKASELKAIAIDVAPGWDYQSATWEGGLTSGA